MKKTRMEKGITLIALIVTIVVLLILAVVAISSITNDGILSYAQNAANTWNSAQLKEDAILDNYTNYLKEYASTTKIIEFSINGTKYYAVEGMNWYEWCNSGYNTSSEWVCNSLESQITDGGDYSTGFEYIKNNVDDDILIGEDIIGESITYQTRFQGADDEL